MPIINNDIDNSLLYTDPLTLKSYPAWLVQAVDTLLYKIRHKDIWEICDFAISFWAKKNPREYRLFLDANKRFKLSRKNKFASTESMDMRQLAHIPSDVSYILDKIAGHKIEEYGKLKFWRAFAKRYPGFSTAEKV
jgi:hypothetical protein